MLRRFTRGVFLATFLAIPLQASVASTDLMLPVVGHAVAPGSRQYHTTLHLIALADAAEVTLEFRATSSKAPVITKRSIAARGALIFDLDSTVLGADVAIGSLRVRSSSPVLAAARITMTEGAAAPGSELSTTIEAVPCDRAIGNGESAIIPGLSGNAAEYKLYVAETTGQPMHIELAAVGTDGKVIASRRMFVDAGQQLSIPVSPTLSLPPGATGYMLVRGVNGSGRVVATGELVSSISRDSSVFGMQMVQGPRYRLSAGELLLYAGVGVVIAVAAFRRRRA